MRVVIDTGVLISALIRVDSMPAKVFRIGIQDHKVLTSKEAIQELMTTLLKPRLQKPRIQAQSVPLLSTYLAFGELVAVTTAITDCRDPKDDKFLALALDGRADVIVSGDEDLLVLHPWRGVRILTPRAFVDEFSRDP